MVFATDSGLGPFDKSEIVTIGNYTDSELCFIKLMGIVKNDGVGREAYGLWTDAEISELLFFMSEADYPEPILDHSRFVQQTTPSGWLNYVVGEDYWYIRDAAYKENRVHELRRHGFHF